MNISRLQLLTAAHGAPAHGQPGVVGSAPTNHSRDLMKPSSLRIQAKLRSNRSVKALVGALLLLVATGATADTPTYYWDTNGSDGGAGNPPDGVWASDTPMWTSDSSGASPTFAYPARANIVFAATVDPTWNDTLDYTVTIDGVQQVSDIVIQDGNCTLTNASGYLDKDTPFISVLNPGQIATMNSVIASAAGTSDGITKSAPGTLVLGGTNTYQGPTTIQGGTLQLAAPQVLPGTSTLVLAGGDSDPTFATGGYSQTLGPLLLTGPNTSLTYTIDFGPGASALVFADSHTQDWGGITLFLANYKRGVDSLRFGTSSAGLTSTQLGLIQFGFIDSKNATVVVPAKIDSSGFVTPALPVILSLTISGSTNAVVTWSAINGRRYLVHYKLNLKDAQWSDAPKVMIAPGITASYTNNIGTNASSFYRIQLLPIEPPG